MLTQAGYEVPLQSMRLNVADTLISLKEFDRALELLDGLLKVNQEEKDFEEVVSVYELYEKIYNPKGIIRETLWYQVLAYEEFESSAKRILKMKQLVIRSKLMLNSRDFSMIC